MFRPSNHSSEATTWGLEHESQASKEYERQTGNTVIASGMWLFPEGDLSATPDGLVLDPADQTKYIGVIEVKCPFKYRNTQITTGEEWSTKLRYLDQDNKLKSDSEYYHQIQGELFATTLSWCDFVIWCPTAILIQRIYQDESWRAGSLAALHFIYRNHIMRPEDLVTREYSIALRNRQAIDLRSVIKSNPAIELRFYSALMKAIGVHIGRWMSLKCYPRAIPPEYLAHFDEMKKKSLSSFDT